MHFGAFVERHREKQPMDVTGHRSVDVGRGLVEGPQVFSLGEHVLEKLRLPFLGLGFPFRKRSWDEARSCWIHFRVN